MNEKQRRRIERVLDRTCIRDDYHPQGYIVGISVSHSRYGSGKVRSGSEKSGIRISDISASMCDGSRRPTGAESNEKTSP